MKFLVNKSSCITLSNWNSQSMPIRIPDSFEIPAHCLHYWVSSQPVSAGAACIRYRQLTLICLQLNIQINFLEFGYKWSALEKYTASLFSAKNFLGIDKIVVLWFRCKILVRIGIFCSDKITEKREWRRWRSKVFYETEALWNSEKQFP